MNRSYRAFCFPNVTKTLVNFLQGFPMNTSRFLWVALALLTGSLFAEDEPAKEESKDIPFTVVEGKWKSGVVILIDPKYRTEKDMAALGKTLQKKHLKDEQAHVQIYDNEKAAKMYKFLDPPTGSAGVFYEKHHIGAYHKNNETKLNRFLFGITSKGIMGKRTYEYDLH
jgi:hypothetical protein